MGGWCSIPSPFGAELMGALGFDWVCIDTQHGLIGYDAMWQMLQALSSSGTPAVVRVSSNSPAEIMKALDAGAQGVIVPMVNSAEDAALAVSACRYAPEGQRSWGPTRAALGQSAYTPDSANADTVCIIQVETRSAVDELPNILSVGGIDVAYVGPADLAISYGLPPTFAVADMQHHAVIEQIFTLCNVRGIAAGIHCSAAADAIHWIDEGFSFVTAGSDRGYLAAAASRDLATIMDHSQWKPSGTDWRRQ